MKKYLIFSFVSILFLTQYCQALTLEQLQQRFSQYSVIRANFIQDRTIQGFNQSLHSTGKMIISKDLGLWWQQQTPFVMTLKMNEQRMQQIVGQQPAQIISADDQPQLFQFNTLLAAIFNADRTTLEKNFQLNLSESDHDQQWQLVLIPQSAPLDKIFKQITLNGDQYLAKIVIDDKQNDKTTIVFTEQQTSPLTEHEKRLFE